MIQPALRQTDAVNKIDPDIYSTREKITYNPRLLNNTSQVISKYIRVGENRAKLSEFTNRRLSFSGSISFRKYTDDVDIRRSYASNDVQRHRYRGRYDVVSDGREISLFDMGLVDMFKNHNWIRNK